MKEFKVKSSEEIAKLNEEDNAKYFAGLLDWQTKSIQELTEAKKSEEANKAELEKQINDLTNAQLKTMKSQLDTMGTAFTKLNKELEAKHEDKPLSFKAAIYKSLIDNKERIDSFFRC
jgi:Tfp pilus assembly protein PilO